MMTTRRPVSLRSVACAITLSALSALSCGEARQDPGDSVVVSVGTEFSEGTPFIRSIAVSGLPATLGRPLRLAATVTGAPGQTYRWTVSCADDPAPDPFSAPTRLVTDLTLYRCSSDATVTFAVTNPGSRGSGSLTSTVRLIVSYVPQGVIARVGTNSWPNVTSITSESDTEPSPGATLNIVAAASDPDGDLLTYDWTDDCGGRFSPTNSLTPTWTAPSTPGAVCTLLLTVREAGNVSGHNDGVNSASFTVQVAPAPVFGRSP